MPFPNAFLTFLAMYYSLKINSLALAASFSTWLALPSAAQAQPKDGVSQTAPATLTGTAVDGGAKAEPLSFATVLLRRAEVADTSLVTSGQT